MYNIYEVISYINTYFDNNYANKGFLSGSFHDSVSFFTTQSCWYYAYILKKIFPDGDIYLGDFSVGHVIFKLDNKFYDVTGEYYNYNENNFYCDDEVIGSTIYDHYNNKEVMNMCNLIIGAIYNEFPKIITEKKLNKER